MVLFKRLNLRPGIGYYRYFGSQLFFIEIVRDSLYADSRSRSAYARDETYLSEDA